MERNKTLFQIKVHEHFSKKTKKGAASTGAVIILISVLVGIISMYGWDEFSYWMFGLGLLLSPIAAIGGIVYIAANLLRPTRKVVCTSCKHENNVFRNARSYVCPACDQLLLIGKDTIKQPTFFPCPYCGLKTAVCEDAGPYLCSDCAITLPQKIQGENKQEKCPNCSSLVPSEAIFCKTCGEILRSDIQSLEKEDDKELKYGIEWKAGKSTLGHYYYSKAIIVLINNLLERNNLKGLERSPFDLLKEVLVSLEVASLDNEIYQQCGSLLPGLDKAYRNLLGWELSVLNSVFSQSDNFDSFPPLPMKEEYIGARRRVESIYGDALETFGSIGKWSDKLVAWEEEIRSTSGQPTGRFTVEENGYEQLKEEKSRLDNWVSKQVEIQPHNKANSADAKSRAAD